MKIAYLMAFLLLCGAVAGGCLNMGAEKQASAPSELDYSRNGYTVDVYPTMTPDPHIASLPIGSGSAIDQKLIKTGSISLEVGNVPAIVDALNGIAIRHGGYLSSSSLSAATSDRMSATVVVRVPGDAFEGAVTDIKAIGTVRSASLNSQDITEEYIDLQAQKTALQLQLNQYNRIMEKAENVEDILKIQIEIGRTQTELDRLEGRLRYLDNRVDLATITVYLQEPAPIGGDTGHDFVSVINSGIQGFLGMIDTLFIAFLTFLPLVILGGIGYGIYRWRKAKKETPVAIPEKK
ncbi:MAG: DUF4349 domain-containing protein [Methanomicrobiales archaeon]|nr:DUF4349 domain-containing protein [Methanomicrobiales archaeon]